MILFIPQSAETIVVCLTPRCRPPGGSTDRLKVAADSTLSWRCRSFLICHAGNTHGENRVNTVPGGKPPPYGSGLWQAGRGAGYFATNGAYAWRRRLSTTCLAALVLAAAQSLPDPRMQKEASACRRAAPSDSPGPHWPDTPAAHRPDAGLHVVRRVKARWRARARALEQRRSIPGSYAHASGLQVYLPAVRARNSGIGSSFRHAVRASPG